MRIDPVIRNLNENASGARIPKAAQPSDANSFAEQLKTKIGEVNQMQVQADNAMAESSVKGAANIHETMIRLEEADMSLRMLTKFRNKALDAYHEVMRMQF
ncbi:MAG: flagellar hook-basal body complex protein FliE [Desulfobacteraceae bacterium]|nr:flagellar hook-basal body complex protein FliE [Desulfobacteraceae bacterium]